MERVKGRWPNIKKSRKILKKLENIPKYKLLVFELIFKVTKG